MTRKADYVYKNADDTRRVRIFRRDTGRWDFDEFQRFPGGGWRMTTFSVDGATDTFATKREALATAEDYTSQLTPINPEIVTEGWPEKPAPKVTADAHVLILVGQVWRFGTRRLIVESYTPHWNQKLCPGEFEVGCRFISPSGRERGVQIRHRKSASQRYREQGFREKFRYVAPATPPTPDGEPEE